MAINFKLLLVLALCTLSVSGDLLYSIDCGTPSSAFYSDGNSILWMGDSDLFQTGSSSQVVQSSNSISHVMDTLRVFTSRKKNCYNFKVDKGEKVLVRASFFYGNYDKKSSPPTFDLHFDGNFWDTVETSTTDMVYYEVIYVVKGSVLTVCVAQTKPNQFPFMSALEVRSLDMKMYSLVDSSVALFLRNRIAYGASSPIRFSDDSYDRIWEPATNVGQGLLKVTNDALFINVNDIDDNPPQGLLQNAITTSSPSQSISSELPAAKFPLYMTWYFSEVTSLDSTQMRSLRVYQNNQSLSKPILPPYGGAIEFSASNLTVSSKTRFSVVPTADSTLPPLISGLEIFYISTLADGTNSKDIEGLLSLHKTFKVLNDWGGDPCLPSSYSWEWITCSSDAIPRVTEINLDSFDLHGIIPDFSSMDALEAINLQNNSLTGPIPDFLGTLPNLQQINLADNQLSGPIPPSLLKKNNLKLIVTGNPSLCKSGCEVSDTSGSVPANRSSAGRSKKKSKLPIILGIVIPVFFLFWAIMGLLLILRKRRSAAVAAAAAGRGGGADNLNGMPQGSNTNGEVAMKHEFKANMEDGEN